MLKGENWQNVALTGSYEKLCKVYRYAEKKCEKGLILKVTGISTIFNLLPPNGIRY